MSKLSFKQILLFGVLIEILIFLIFYLLKDNIGDIFRYSARYSGRVSLIIYLCCFHLFYQSVLVKGNLKRLKELVCFAKQDPRKLKYGRTQAWPGRAVKQ